MRAKYGLDVVGAEEVRLDKGTELYIYMYIYIYISMGKTEPESSMRGIIVR
jgi:hypothetical protein